MIVKMKSGSEYLISDKRGQLLQSLLAHGTAKPFINLDGRGMMVKPELIEKIYSEQPEQTVNPRTQAWKQAIRHNLKVMRQTGRMGHATAEDFLENSIESAVAAG